MARRSLARLLRAEPYYAAAKIATVSPSATRVTLASSGWNNFFRVVADDGVQGPADADYLVKTKSFKTIYVVNDGTAYGAGLASAVATQATSDGATVTTATVPGNLAVPERLGVGHGVLGRGDPGCRQ